MRSASIGGQRHPARAARPNGPDGRTAPVSGAASPGTLRAGSDGALARTAPGPRGPERPHRRDGLDRASRTGHRGPVRPSREPADPYAVLGVQPGASRAEVRRAYRRRALEIHPDTAATGDEAATDAMVRLNRARDQLLARGPGRATRPPDASADASGASGPRSDATTPPEPRERPAWADAHDAAWTDHWAAWNEPRRRE